MNSKVFLIGLGVIVSIGIVFFSLTFDSKLESQHTMPDNDVVISDFNLAIDRTNNVSILPVFVEFDGHINCIENIHLTIKEFNSPQKVVFEKLYDRSCSGDTNDREFKENRKVDLTHVEPIVLENGKYKAELRYLADNQSHFADDAIFSMDYSPTTREISSDFKVDLDTSQYSLGDVITFTGQTSPSVTNNYIVATLYGPNNEIIAADKVTLDNSKNFKHFFETKSSWDLGVYTIELRDPSAQTKISVELLS